MTLTARIARLERLTRIPRLVADLEAGRRKLADLSDMELDELASARPVWMDDLLGQMSNEDLQRIVDGDFSPIRAAQYGAK